MCVWRVEIYSHVFEMYENYSQKYSHLYTAYVNYLDMYISCI